MDKWVKINAYVDGELEVREAAKIAEEAAIDPIIARDIAELTQLKATLSSCSEPFEGDVNIRSSKHRLFLSPPWLMVASFSFLTITILLFLQGRAGVAETRLIDSVLLFHQSWAEAVASNHHSSIAAPLNISNIVADTGMTYVPNLSGLGLELSNIAYFNNKSTPGWHLGYLGVNGCKVSLFVLQNSTLPVSDNNYTMRQKISQDAATIYYWSNSHTLYYLTAASMTQKRLEAVSQALFLQTRNNQPLENMQLLAFKELYALSGFCVS